MFAVVLASAKTHRSLLFASGIYGMTAAVLTLIHEAVPFLQALGAVLAIVVLVHSSVKIQRLSALLAVAPGLVVVLAIAVLGRRDASSRCVLGCHIEPLTSRASYRPVRFSAVNTPTRTTTTGPVASSASQQENLLSLDLARSVGALGSLRHWLGLLSSR